MTLEFVGKYFVTKLPSGRVYCEELGIVFDSLIEAYNEIMGCNGNCDMCIGCGE